jgi:Ca-activated chloride channel family protein
MTKAAQFGRGTYTYIGSPGEVGEKMGALFRKLEHPVLSDVGINWGGDDIETWPVRVPDLYAGEPVVLLARLGRTSSAELTVTARRDVEPWEARLRVGAGPDETGIHKLWARKKIAGLMDRLREGADRGEIRRTVVAVALQHHLVSAYTSLVAVDVTPTRAEGSPGRTANVPVALPAGMVYEKVFGTLPKTATPAPLYLALGLASLALAVCVFRRAFSPGGVR